ncbi:MAG: MMPL family transporter [Treponema sp.]|jgi:predicted RND superfamily exporter protein|nr:MMPL family transporter [Treponema sp.]
MQRFFRRSWIIVAVVAGITVFFAAQFPRAELDNNNIRFVPENDPARLASTEISDTFGSSASIIVALEHKYKTVFDLAFLQAVKEYTEYIDEQCEIVGDVSSIMDIDYIAASDDSIVVENLVPENFMGTAEEIAALKRKLLSWDMYDRSLVSDDFTATQILFPLEIGNDEAGNEQVMETFRAIRAAAHEMFDGMANVYVAGLPVISAAVSEAMGADLVFLIPMVVIVALTVLFFSFRQLTAVLLPLITVIIAVVWSIGAMPLLGVKLSILSTVLPVILVAVGSAYGIHVVTHYREDLDERRLPLSMEEHRELVFALLRKIGKPVSLAAFTTFAGFISFCFTTVPPIREFGYFSSFGVIASFIVAITLIPALLLIRGPKPMSVKGEVSPSLQPPQAASSASPSTGEAPVTPPSVDTSAAQGNRLTNSLMGIARKKYFILVCAVLVTAVSIYGMSKLVIDNVFIEYFKTSTDVRQSDVFIREKFGGTKMVNIVVESDDTTVLLSPKVLTAVDGLQTFLRDRVNGVGKVMGFTDLIKRTNQVFNVDEGPDGVRVRALNAVAEQAFEDEDFGFGDFGGGVAGAIGTDWSAPAEGVAEDREAGWSEGETSPLQNILIDIALLDQAVDVQDISATDLVRRAKRLVNYEGAAYYEIPADPAKYGKTDDAELSSLIANYLVLIAGNSSDYANDALEPTAIRTTVQLRTTGDADTKAVLARIDDYIAANFPKEARTRIGGLALIESSLSGLVVHSQIVSVAVSIFMVFLIIMFSNRSGIAGVVGILPLLISILINFAAMGFLGIKLNLGTSLVASVSVGVGIDYAIHFIDAYKREYRSGRDDFLRRAFATSGKAIIINAVSVGAGFAVLTLSQFVILADLGLLMALTMFTSALISLTVIPAALTILKPKFIYGRG